MDGLLEVAALMAAAVFGGMETVYGYWAYCGDEEPFHKVWKSRLFYSSFLLWWAVLLIVWYGAAAAGQDWRGIMPGSESILAVRFAAIFITYLLLTGVDIRRKIVPDRILLCSLVSQLLMAASSQEAAQWGRCLIEGIIFMAVLLAIAWILRGGLGMGDAKLLGMTAMTAGWMYAFWLLIVGMVISFFIGIWMLVFRKMSAKTEMPFVPFLTAGMAAQVLYLLKA